MRKAAVCSAFVSLTLVRNPAGAAAAAEAAPGADRHSGISLQTF